MVIDPTFPSGEAEHAFVSAPGTGVLTDLGTFGGGQSRGARINQSGQVTGSSTIDRFGTASTWLHWRAFLYTNGQMINLGTLGGNVSMGTAINDRGQVTGFSETPTPDNFHAFLWSEGVMTDLSTPGLQGINATAINNEGEVTGRAVTAAGEGHAYLYSNGRMLDLNALVIDDPLAKYVTLVAGVAINDSHMIVANGFDSRGSGSYYYYFLVPK
jgi:probable HAF family extracellular repeat protein